MMFICLNLAALFALASPALAAPAITAPSTLSIPVKDLVSNDLANHEAHPLFDLYTRWLETDIHGSVFRRDLNGTLAQHPTLVSIECREDLDTCLLASRMAIPSGLTPAMVESNFGKRGFLWDIGKLKTEVTYKTYHWLENDEGEEVWSGYQHDITWDWSCQSVLYVAAGMSLANHGMQLGQISPGVSAHAWVDAVILYKPEKPRHIVHLAASFSCGLFSNKCCEAYWDTWYRIGGKESVPAGETTFSCNAGKQVDKCDQN
ncbi:uncharacterized protein CTRU02_213818 [Colletotrichum truncatum]|uniref:Uncharacterized protein n=1 Tax=Colletotrichum truncatum TaxID=5467 RepID=A0ACC3YGR3_COLTU|nr:uncharacterized protein CTRU02_12840 [Colletotrichum truncatum]KAF6784073.1 hypothetical protein CTRU02_12840 [Colletotrichum truncatum]